MGGVTISTAGTQARFGITAVKTGILCDHLTSTGRSFSLHHSPSSYKKICKQKSPSASVAKVEHGSQNCESSPILSVSQSLPLCSRSNSIGRQEGFSAGGGSKGPGKKTDTSAASALKEDSICTIPIATVQVLDYGEAAATLEHIYNDSPASVSGSDLDTSSNIKKRKRGRSKTKTKTLGVNAVIKPTNVKGGNGELKSKGTFPTKDKGKGKIVRLVRSSGEKERKKRLSLDLRIALRKAKLESKQFKNQRAKPTKNEDQIEMSNSNDDTVFWCEQVDELIRSYTMCLRVGPMSLDWTRLRVRRLLSPSEHIWLAKLMKPMKFYLQTKENLRKVVGREPRDDEIAAALKVPLPTFRRHIEAGQAARNKLIQHNLRLVLFEVYKHNLEGAGLSFEDACQEGTKGLVVAIDRYEPSKGFRLSTYAMYWIRHFILRAITVSTLIRPPFAFAALKVEMQRATLELLVELGRTPTHEEIRAKMGLHKERYNYLVRSFQKVRSLDDPFHHARLHNNDVLTDPQNADYQAIRPQALLRLGLDDVLDSLKPKESLVVRQRFGLDGKGERSLGEVARNLNISREMVRKHEVKAMLKLKHPSRKEYLRAFLSP